MKHLNNLTSLLKKADPALRKYVSEFKKEINRLQKYNVKLEVQRISDQSKIKVLEKMQPDAKIIIRDNTSNTHKVPPEK